MKLIGYWSRSLCHAKTTRHYTQRMFDRSAGRVVTTSEPGGVSFYDQEELLRLAVDAGSQGANRKTSSEKTLTYGI